MKRPRLAILCTELATIRSIADAIASHYQTQWARDAASLWKVLAEEREPAIAVIIDNAVAGIGAVELLGKIRKDWPYVRRILLSDYCDLSLIVQGLHTGAVERIVYKPVYDMELMAAITPANATAGNGRATASGRAPISVAAASTAI